MRTQECDPIQAVKIIKRERAKQEQQRRYVAAVRRLVDNAPPLTEDQRLRLLVLLGSAL